MLPALEKQHPKLACRKQPLEVGLVSIEPFSGKVSGLGSGAVILPWRSLTTSRKRGVS